MKSCKCGFCRPPDHSKATQLGGGLVQYDTGIISLNGETLCRITHCRPEVMELIQEALLNHCRPIGLMTRILDAAP